MNSELRFHLRAMTRLVYYVTEEEDRFLKELSEELDASYHDNIFAFNSTLGLLPLHRLIADWSNRAHAANVDCPDIHQALITAYKDDPKKVKNFYVFLDPERYLGDPQVQRRILNIANQLHNNDLVVKTLIFVSNRLVIPPKLQRYIEVVHDKGLPVEALEDQVTKACESLEMDVPRNIPKLFKGLTSFETSAIIAQCMIKTLEDTPRIDPKVLGDYRRRQLHKTDLLNFIDVADYSFDIVGGNGRFKEWAVKTKSTWTEEGQKFGLIPPKGVLCVGVWGCLAEGTRIDYRRGARESSRGRSLPIEALFEKFNGIKGSAKSSPPWIPGLPTYLQSWCAETGRIVYNEMSGIVDSGLQECFRIVTSTGMVLELTGNHPVLMEDGNFRPVEEIQPGDTLIVRGSMRLSSAVKGKQAVKKRVIVEGLKYHPIAWKKFVTEPTTGVLYTYGRTTRARLVFEAWMNKLSYEEYIRILKEDPEVAETLEFIPPEYDVHHMDEDTLNDDIGNLMLLLHERHAQLHQGITPIHDQREFTKRSKVLSIHSVGQRRTFDIEMRLPYSNFVTTEGFIVHNCGKSLSVKAMGHAWKLPVVQMEMGRLRSSAVGESEANIYRAISLIESVAPCIVFIDEAEKSLSGGQSSAQSDAGTTSRVIGILSNWLQETKAHICLAMTANSVKTLPVEFINRMDERFFFDLPSDEERIEILKIHLRKRNQDPALFNLAALSEKAINMVGREIEQAIGAALVNSFESNKPALDEGILLAELASKPRIFKTMGDELKEVLDWVGYDPDMNEGVRARFASSKRSETFKAFRVE
jgi:SpoVK/Ycf46/Vps4 family AAA+-type ATPase